MVEPAFFFNQSFKCIYRLEVGEATSFLSWNQYKSNSMVKIGKNIIQMIEWHPCVKNIKMILVGS
jgi:hypothetical protein